MSPAKRIYGARPSPRRPALAGAAEPFVLPAPSQNVPLFSWVTYVDDQTGQDCIGEGCSQGLWIAGRGQGQRCSPRGTYVGARAREVASAKGAPIPDVGSRMVDAVEFLVEQGGFARDARDGDPTQVTALENFAEQSASILVPAAAFHPIDQGDTNTVDQWLTAAFGVVFCMPVDQSYEDFTGPGIWSGMTGPTLGGHCQCLAGSDPDAYLVWGSWGTALGNNGIARIARSWFAQNAFDLVAISESPVFA